MHQLQELIRLHRLGTTAQKTAKQLGIDRKTERRYRRRLRQAGLLEGAPDDLPALADVKAAVRRETKPPPQERSSVEPWRETVSMLLDRGCGPTAIHGQLGERFNDYDGSLSAVKRLCTRIRTQRGPRPQDVAIPVHAAPGAEAQVDFCYVGKLLDAKTNRTRKAYVFVMVLSHSRWMFAEIVFGQDIETWLTLHRRAFKALRGVPQVVVPDNLKAAVTKAVFGASEMGTLQRSYRELARHYGFAIDPTPAYAPEKKGKVESGVRYVKSSFFAPRSDTFRDLDEANRALAVWLAETANQRVHGTTGRVPAEVLAEVELAALRGLPSEPYVPVLWHKAKVARNAHVAFRGRFYSVPFVHIGAEAWLRIRGEAVDVHVHDEPVAHHRLHGDTPWSTNPSHLPEGRRDLARRDPNHWYERADRLGDEVGAYIREVMASDEVHYPLRRIQSIVPALEALAPDRARSVVSRARRYACFKPDAVKRIIRDNLDLEPPEGGPIDPGWVTKPVYARDAEDFLGRMEVNHGHA